MPDDAEKVVDESPKAEEVVKYRDPTTGQFITPAGKEPGTMAKRTNTRAHSIRELAKPYTNEALVTILGIMRDAGVKENTRLHAAETVLAYAWGRPAALEWAEEGPTNPLQGWSTRELHVMLLKAVQSPESVIDVTPEKEEDDSEDDPE